MVDNMSKAELIKYYNENKGKEHIAYDAVTGQTFKLSEREWEQNIRKAINSKMPADERLAILLHSKLCHDSHVDRCGWSYEVNGFDHLWNKPEHSRWLDKARAVIRVANGRADIDTICDIIGEI